MCSAQNVCKVRISSTNISWPHVMPFQAKFPMGRQNGKIADFLWSMHGLCAYHVMREEGLTQQKIGLHFVTGLAIRKTTRGVNCLAVPDIANSLKTNFGMGRVLKILHDAGLIDWYAVDVDIVKEAVTDLMSL